MDIEVGSGEKGECFKLELALRPHCRCDEGAGRRRRRGKHEELRFSHRTPCAALSSQRGLELAEVELRMQASKPQTAGRPMIVRNG